MAQNEMAQNEMAQIKPVRMAIVGAGNIADARHMPAVQSVGDRVEVVAFVDIDPARAEALAAKWGVKNSYTDLGEMLAAEQPDLVAVCTPPVAHRDAIVECLDAGAWVWCEKPPALSLAEYDSIPVHETDGGPYVAYVFQHRFGSGAEQLRRQIAEGELGRPFVGICNTLWYRGTEYFDLPWRGRWSTEGGGPTMGHGIHQIDLMLSLLGDWKEVRALAATLDRPVETEDVSMAMVTLESGAVVSIVNSLLSPRETSYLRFDFADATVELTHTYGYDNANWSWTPAAHVTDADRIAAWTPAENLRSSHGAQLADLLDSMAAGERPRVSGHDSRRTLEFVAGLYQSAHTGLPVQRTELTPDNPYYHSMSGEMDAASVAVSV